MAIDYGALNIQALMQERQRREAEEKQRKSEEPNWLGALAGGLTNYFLGGSKDQGVKTALGALSGYLTPKSEYGNDVRNALAGGLNAYQMAGQVDTNRLAQEKAAREEAKSQREEAEAPLDKAVLIGKFLQSAKPIPWLKGELKPGETLPEDAKDAFYLPGVIPGVDWWKWQQSPFAAMIAPQ